MASARGNTGVPPLTVLVVAPWARRHGGAEEMLWTLLKAHDRARVRFGVAFLEAGPFEREVAALGVATAVVPAGQLRSPLRVARTVGALTRLIRRTRPDVVLNWMAKTQLYGAPAAALSRTGAPIVWWQHLIPGGHWMDRLATRLPAAAIGASSESSAVAQRATPPARRTVCVHPGVELSGAVVPAAGPSPESVVVVIVGRLQPWKGQDRAIRAVRLLRGRGLPVELLVVGGAAFGFDEDYPAALEALVAELDLGEHVRFTGQVDDARPHLARGDIALNASEGEPFGIVLIEAMALGRPVVAVEAAGPLEITDAGRTGRLASDGSPEALAAALAPLVEDPDLRSTLGAAGRERAEREFSAVAMADGITALLESVVA